MSKPQPAAPRTPDPTQVAGAQTGANVAASQANAVAANPNVVGPQGSTTYSAGENYTMTGPDGQTYQIPRYTQTTTLSPEQQKLYDQQTALGGSLNNLAQGQVDRLGGVLGQPMPSLGAFPGSPQLQTSFGDAGEIQKSIGPTDYSEDRKRVEDAIYSRLNPQLDRDRASLENTLVNQGFQRGTEGFTREMDQSGRDANDARMQAILAGGSEQSRLAGLDLAKGQFANSAQQQSYDQLLGRAGFGNTAMGQQFGMDTAGRSQNLQEMLAMRNQPINEISALMSGGQVSLPGMQQYNAPSIGAAPIGDYNYNTAALQNSQWQTQQQTAAQKQAALYGGLGGLGGAALYGGATGKLGGLFGKG